MTLLFDCGRVVIGRDLTPNWLCRLPGAGNRRAHSSGKSVGINRHESWFLVLAADHCAALEPMFALILFDQRTAVQSLFSKVLVTLSISKTVKSFTEGNPFGPRPAKIPFTASCSLFLQERRAGSHCRELESAARSRPFDALHAGLPRDSQKGIVGPFEQSSDPFPTEIKSSTNSACSFGSTATNACALSARRGSRCRLRPALRRNRPTRIDRSGELSEV
jgi:hypothetical protein